VNTVLLITPGDALRARLLGALDDYSAFIAQSDAEALKILRLIDIDLILRDSGGLHRGLEAFLAQVREITPAAVTIAIGASEDERDLTDFRVAAGCSPRELDSALRQAQDKLRLVRELASLRSSAVPVPQPAAPPLEEPWDRAALAGVLTEFTRAFAAGFDLPRALDMFLDAIGELVRPTRTALLLPDADARDYRVVAHRGLAPQIVESVRLPATAGLARWLATQGRPARIHELTDPEIIRELKLLQSVLAVPLLAYGELVAILLVGQPVVGSSYGRRETETLFDLAMHLATAIRDIALHNQLEREKEFTERILDHMSSGVITIGRDQRVSRMNRRAEEILSLPAHSVINEDLRALPSPLGDMLYDTLRSGRTVSRAELQLALRGLWLEVSTYPVRGDDLAPLGAVLVLEDLTAQKELATQKRQAEQTQLLTRVIARIADEIKNPLVSVNTFVELIGERYDDPDFRKHFASVVRRDVRRMVEVFEKLAALVTEGELNFSTVDVHTVVDDVMTAIELADDGLGKPLQLEVTRDPSPQMVKVDVTQLRKALSYLVWYLTHNSPPNQARVSLSIGRHAPRDGGESVRILIGSRTATVPPDKLHRLFDPVLMVQEGLIDVGPAVSQRLVEAAGGQLSVRQAKNELAFLVSLPLATS
jgi:nitrogen-specific signal transduction histidine kinase